VSGLEITCLNKDHRQLIVRLGGDGWTMPIQEAIVALISRQLRLHIRVNGAWQDVGVRGEGFDSYLALEPDGFPLHNLVDFQSC
jgi:hypothetical protein